MVQLVVVEYSIEECRENKGKNRGEIERQQYGERHQRNNGEQPYGKILPEGIKLQAADFL